MEEEKNTLKYQKTMNVDVENIASKKQLFWRPIYEVIGNSYFEATKLFLTIILDQCRKIQINLRTYQMKSKQI